MLNSEKMEVLLAELFLKSTFVAMWSRITRSISKNVQFITFASHIFQKILISYTTTVFRKALCDTAFVLYDYLLC